MQQKSRRMAPSPAMNEEPKIHDGFLSWQPSPLNGEGHQKVLILLNVTLALEGRGLEPEANWF
jgi:hypothetical protein